MRKKIQKHLKTNTWLAKTKRTITAVLPVDEKRVGKCRQCGSCCKLPNVCPHLRYDENGKSMCAIYAIRPLNCRKYPRTKEECLTQEVCGYHFEKASKKQK